MPPLRHTGETWSITGVYLVTDSNDGRVAIPHLQLNFVADGIELAKADGLVAWRCGWPNLDELSTVERSVLPDGSPGSVILVAEHGGPHHRFVVPAADPQALEADIRELARAHRVHTSMPPTAVSRTLTLAVGVAAVSTLTVLLLSAAHVLHF
jgi:hypothetical protein